MIGERRQASFPWGLGILFGIALLLLQMARISEATLSIEAPPAPADGAFCPTDDEILMASILLAEAAGVYGETTTVNLPGYGDLLCWQHGYAKHGGAYWAALKAIQAGADFDKYHCEDRNRDYLVTKIDGKPYMVVVDLLERGVATAFRTKNGYVKSVVKRDDCYKPGPPSAGAALAY